MASHSYVTDVQVVSARFTIVKLGNRSCVRETLNANVMSCRDTPSLVEKKLAKEQSKEREREWRLQMQLWTIIFVSSNLSKKERNSI